MSTIEKWLDEQRINGGAHGFECIGIERMSQVWDAAFNDGYLKGMMAFLDSVRIERETLARQREISDGA